MKGVLKITTVNKSKNKIQDFKVKYVDGRFVNEINDIYERVNKNREKIQQNLISKFNEVFTKAYNLQQNKLKGSIKYIYISYLRSSLFEGKAIYRIDLYDEKWFLDKAECVVHVDFNFIFENLFIHMKELYEKKKEYGISISECDVEKIMLNEADKYHHLAVEILNNLVSDSIKSDEYNMMIKNDELMIFAGEFRDESKLLLRLKGR